jgi:hypothetical protein
MEDKGTSLVSQPTIYRVSVGVRLSPVFPRPVEQIVRTCNVKRFYTIATLKEGKAKAKVADLCGKYMTSDAYPTKLALCSSKSSSLPYTLLLGNDKILYYPLGKVLCTFICQKI